MELGKKTRKFKDLEQFDKQVGNTYYLQPFKFHRINSQRELLVNEVGDYLVLPNGTVERIVLKKINKEVDFSLYADLLANNFISENVLSPLTDIFATRYRTKKSFLDHFTNLHIFVVTLRCEHTCQYCQVSRVTTEKGKFDISFEHIDKGIDLMFKSPSQNVTMEFQGGEALLAFDKIVYAVNQTKKLAIQHNKTINYVICTNLAVIDEDILLFCKLNNILISTSLDGPSFIHNENRRRPGKNSYELTIKGINLCRNILGSGQVSALMTTTNLSLNYPVEIVEEYFKQGFRNIFLRPISPYGFAVRNEKKNKYETEKFLSFYKAALNRILQYNFDGIYFREDYATIILRKILTPFPVGYVDLNSPSGAITNAIVFNYDGDIYASDEGRMLAEMQDFEFRLGSLDEQSYEEIFYGEKAQELISNGINESLPGCSDCAFQSYCGADPIHNHATQGDAIGYRPTNTFCQKNMEIIRYLIQLMDDNIKIKRIFESWVKPKI